MAKIEKPLKFATNNMEIKDYLNLPYNKVIQKIDDDSGSYYYGKILELDGCQSTGDTLEELILSLDEAMEGYIECKLDGGFTVPVPETNDDFSGKFVLRLPKSLHKKLSVQATNDGVSLNQYRGPLKSDVDKM